MIATILPISESSLCRLKGSVPAPIASAVSRITSLSDYAEELTEGTTQIPEHLAYYIDYERMGRNMALSGDIFTTETGCQEVHIFWSH